MSPVVALTAAPLVYTENDPATVVDGGATVADADTPNIASAEVKITNPQTGDELSYATTDGIAGTVNAGKDTVTFSGSGHEGDYQAALRAVKFRNTSDTPSRRPGARCASRSRRQQDSNTADAHDQRDRRERRPGAQPGRGSGLQLPVQVRDQPGAGDGQMACPI